MTRSARWVLLALALAVPTSALADPKDDARRRFQQGVDLARGGDLRGALDQFIEADGIFQHPATTYNIAFAYQQLGELDESIEWYRKLEQQAPNRADEVEAIIVELEARKDAQRAAAVAAAAPRGGGDGAALASAEIERLRAIAAELESLAAKVAERGPADGPGADGSGSTPNGLDPAGDTAPIGGTGDDGFLGDAYERVVVTASRYGQEPLDSPSTVSIISAEDIRMSGAIALEDVLRRVVGVDVMALSAGQPEVSIRGFNRQMNNKVLVLIDGRSVYWDFIGTTQWGKFPIVVEEIERIEVIRGPGSAVYGANAVTGVVNIITKTPGETPETVASVTAGLPGVVRGTAYTSGRAGQTAYRLSAGYDQHGRWSKPEDLVDGGSGVPFFEKRELASQHIRAHGRIDRALSDQGFLSLSGGYVQGRTEAYLIGALGNYGIDSQNGYVRADLTYGPVHARAFYNRVAGDTGPWVTSAQAAERFQSPFLGQTLDAELEAFGDFETGSVTHRVNGGVGYRRKSISLFSYLDYEGKDSIEEDHFNAFINEEATAGRLKVVASLRADRHPLIDLDKTLSPRGAAIVRFGDRSARVTAGTAFRVPTLVESYMDAPISTDVDGVYVRDIGDKDLVPERIVTVEAGYHDESTLYHRADVAVFYNRVTNLIGLTSVTPGFAPYDPDNEGFAAGTSGWANLDDVYQGAGIELDGNLYPADGLDVFANLNVQAIFRDSPGEDAVRDQATSLVKANAGVQYRSPYRLDVSAAGHFVSAQTWALREFDEQGQLVTNEQSVPARFIVTARVGVRPFPDDDLELSVTGWNLAALADDLRFREQPEGQLVGPRLYGTVSYRF